MEVMEHQGLKGIYTCPMHPDITRDGPGICPECGMGLVPAKRPKNEPKGMDLRSFGRHGSRHTDVFERKFWVSLALSVPLVLYSDMIPAIFRWSPPSFAGLAEVQLAVASAVFFYGGGVFLASAWRELKARLPGMMTLIGLAITTAYAWSVYAVSAGRSDTLFWELATLITIMLLGHWIEMRAVRGAQGALRELSKLLPDTAEVMRGNTTEVVPLSEVREGDVILVKPGGKVAADGEVIDGRSSVDESLATGESKPVPKRAGDGVIAGTVNGDGALRVTVTKIGERTFLAGVIRLVREAQASKSRLQVLSDRAALWLTAIAVTAGAVTVVAWIASGAGTAFAIERLVAVLVIACPHAMGLAVPLVASIATTKAAKNGFLVKQRLALEAARTIDTVFFDKTGTLTEGVPEVDEIRVPKDYFPVVLALETNSAHPLAAAIVRRLEEGGLPSSRAEEFRNTSGRGVSGVVEGERYFFGNYAFLKEHGIRLSEGEKEEIKGHEAKARTVVMLADERRYLGFFALSDAVRASAREAVRDLKKMGIAVVMLTGDNSLTAEMVAERLGIDAYRARLSPEEKLAAIREERGEGKRVAMVGDGINDAPALTEADLGIAIGAGTNVAVESAGIILVKNDPRDIPKIIALSRLTYAKMVQNLWWAAGYNIVAIPLAAGVLASRGIVLSPALGAVLMSLSTVIVAANAMLLKRSRLR